MERTGHLDPTVWRGAPSAPLTSAPCFCSLLCLCLTRMWVSHLCNTFFPFFLHLTTLLVSSSMDLNISPFFLLISLPIFHFNYFKPLSISFLITFLLKSNKNYIYIPFIYLFSCLILYVVL